jgi:hypothetical protein
LWWSTTFRGIRDRKVVEARGKVPRELFEDEVENQGVFRIVRFLSEKVRRFPIPMSWL